MLQADWLAQSDHDAAVAFRVQMLEARLCHLAGDTASCERLLANGPHYLRELDALQLQKDGILLLQAIESAGLFHMSFSVLRMLEKETEARGEWQLRGRLYLHRIRALMESEDVLGARASCLEGMRRLPRADLGRRLDLASALALTETVLGRTARVLPILRWMLRQVRQAPEGVCSGSLLSNLSGYYANLGDYDTARDLIQQALPLLREQGSPAALRAGLHNLAVLHVRLGDPLQADQVFEEAIQVAVENGLFEAVRQSARLRARTALDSGDHSRACRYLRLCREYHDLEMRREQARFSRFLYARHLARLDELMDHEQPQAVGLLKLRRRISSCEEDLRYVNSRLQALRVLRERCPSCGRSLEAEERKASLGRKEKA